MKKMMLTAAMACGMLALPVFASADNAMGHDAMAGSAMSAMMICRHATANEKPVAMMADGSKVGLVCKTVSAEMMAKIKAKTAGPDLSGALSAQQADDAWRRWLAQMFTVPGTGGG